MAGRHIPELSFTDTRPDKLGIFLLTALLLFLPHKLPAAVDNLQSLFNFQTRMAAQGNSEAMIKLGEMCEEGLGTEKSEECAKEWYQKARDKGNPQGQIHLDQLHIKHELAAREKAARDKLAREQAERELAEREAAAEREAEEKRDAARKEMTPEERAYAREEAIRRAEEGYQQSLRKQLEKEKAESEALKRMRVTVQDN